MEKTTKIKNIICKVIEIRAEEYARNLEIERESVRELEDVIEIVNAISDFSWPEKDKLVLLLNVLKITSKSSFILNSENEIVRIPEEDQSVLVIKDNKFNLVINLSNKHIMIERPNLLSNKMKPKSNPLHEEFLTFWENFNSSKSKEDKKILVEIYMKLNEMKPTFLAKAKVKEEEILSFKKRVEEDMAIFYYELKSWNKLQEDLEKKKNEDKLLLEDLSEDLNSFKSKGWKVELSNLSYLELEDIFE